MTIPPHIERILDAAHIAPSHDNMQPWRFVVEDETVSFLADGERDRSPANAAGRMARIAVGAAVECALLRAGRMGATVRFEPPRGNALVTLNITGPKRTPEPDKALVRRATNRRLYDGRALDDATFAWLSEATPPLDASRTHWFGRERVRTLGPILEQGEEAYLADARARDAMIKAIRFDVRDREEVTRGLSVGSLELSPADRMTLDLLRHATDERLGQAHKRMGARVRRLVESASGVCVVTTTGTDPQADVAVGRSMQHAWLALTRKGLVAQPITSIVQLEAMLELAANAPPTPETDLAKAAVAALRGAFPGVERGARIAMLLRVGWGPDPTTHVRRLPLEDSIAHPEG
jgi:nitroreductase